MLYSRPPMCSVGAESEEFVREVELQYHMPVTSVRNLLGRWFGIAGAGIALIGTLIAASGGFPPLGFIPDFLSSHDLAKTAWESILPPVFHDGGFSGAPRSRLESGDLGFDALASILVRRVPLLTQGPISAVLVEPFMGRDELVFYTVSVKIEGVDDGVTVAEPASITRWLIDERRVWGLRNGLPILSLGLLISLTGQALVPRKPRDGERKVSRGRVAASGFRVVIVVGLIVIATVVLLEFGFGHKIVGPLGNLALVITLIVLARSAYDTYRLTQARLVPAASFTITHPDPLNRPFLLNTFPRNFSKIPIECRCDLHSRVYGEEISYGGFYGGKEPWFLQPLQQPRGVVDLQVLLDRRRLNEEERRERFEHSTKEERQHLLTLNVEFWYRTLDGTFESHHFREGYYYDFAKGKLVLFPHLEQIEQGD